MIMNKTINLKKLLVFILFFSLSFGAFAQRGISRTHLNYQNVDLKTFHYGFTLGVNLMDYEIAMKSRDYYLAEVVEPKLGFNVGIIGEYKLSDDFSVRLTPGVVFGGRTIQYTNTKAESVGSYSNTIAFEMPVLIKYSAQRHKNTRGYLIAGGALKYDMTSENSFNPEGAVYTKNSPWDFTIELGAGFDWYFPFFKLSTEARLSIGIMDVINHEITDDEKLKYPGIEKYTTNIERMKSSMVSLLFHFE